MLDAEGHAEVVAGAKYIARSPKLMDILDAVSATYCIGKRDIISHSRLANIVVARDAFYYLARHLTARTLAEIGRFLDNRHHATVLHGVQKVSADFDRRKIKLVAVLMRLGIDVARIMDRA